MRAIPTKSKLTAEVGDIIVCTSQEDMLQVMTDLAKQGIFTDFMYEKDGVPGFWLVVEKVDYQQWIDRCN